MDFINMGLNFALKANRSDTKSIEQHSISSQKIADKQNPAFLLFFLKKSISVVLYSCTAHGYYLYCSYYVLKKDKGKIRVFFMVFLYYCNSYVLEVGKGKAARVQQHLSSSLCSITIAIPVYLQLFANSLVHTLTAMISLVHTLTALCMQVNIIFQQKSPGAAL